MTKYEYEKLKPYYAKRSTRKILFIILFIASILGLILSGAAMYNYQQTLFQFSNITTENQLTYILVKAQYTSARYYFIKLDSITEEQYQTFTVILRINQQVTDSIYGTLFILSIACIILSGFQLIYLIAYHY